MTGRPKSPDDFASAGKQIVFVIDDDEAMRATLSSLFRSMGLRVELFGSAREFAQIKMPGVASCLVLDIRLPGVSGLDFQAELAEADIRIPIIFMTGHGDIPMSVLFASARTRRITSLARLPSLMIQSTALRASAKFGVSLSSQRRQAAAALTTAVSGWFTS